MSDVLPEPLVPPEVDLQGMPSFMLNVERLLAWRVGGTGHAGTMLGCAHVVVHSVAYVMAALCSGIKPVPK